MADPKPLSYTTELEGIRAPLGVILYLIRRDNLDIYDIPIARIMREYLDYLNMMEDMQIELAGEFFVLAATLMRIKVQLLLRRDDEAQDDPREDLVRSLLEYKKMVEAARGFRDLEEERRSVFTRRVPDQAKKQRVEEPEIDLSLFRLMKAFHEVMLQFDATEVREIELEEYTIEEKVEAIETELKDREQIAFSDLFKDASSRMELIVTLMALLELLKHGHIKSHQELAFGQIWLYRGENFGKSLGTIEDWDTEPDEPAEVSVPAAGQADYSEDVEERAKVEDAEEAKETEFVEHSKEPDTRRGDEHGTPTG